MRDARSYQPVRRSRNRGDYTEVFVFRVHELIARGYQHLDHATYATEEETTITGDLAESIEEVLEAADEKWMRFYRVHDDPPENQPKSNGKRSRRGKKRTRVDIKIDSSQHSPYQRYRFEAKRLGKGNAARKYVGPSGIGMFLSGEYGPTDAHGGGLGYVQSHDESWWAERIKAEFSKNPDSFQFSEGGEWKHINLIAALSYTFQTLHIRKSSGENLRLVHTLLRFN